MHHVDSQTLWELRSCKECHHYFVSPRPTRKSIGEFYPATYSFYNPKRSKYFIRYFLRFLVVHAYLPKLQPKGDFDYFPRKNPILYILALIFSPTLIKVASGLASPLITAKTYGFNFKKGMRFLEIGCGSGEELFLTSSSLSICSLSKRKIHCVAVEPSLPCRILLQKKGILVYQSVKELILANQSTFDVIRLNWSLEHTDNPLEMFKQLHSVCEKSTRIIITVPNYDGMTYQLAPNFLELPIHLQYFTGKSLKKLAALSGFQVERLHTFSTPGLLAALICYKEGKKDPREILVSERKRILELMDKAHMTDQGDELFCVMKLA